MDESVKKRVDESWKEQAEREKQVAEQPGPAAAQPSRPSAGPATSPRAEEVPDAQFDLFVSSLAMEALIALGEVVHPTTGKHAASLPRAKYLIDLLGVFEAKTKGNLTADEDRLLKDALYQLRMRYLAKTGQA